MIFSCLFIFFHLIIQPFLSFFLFFLKSFYLLLLNLLFICHCSHLHLSVKFSFFFSSFPFEFFILFFQFEDSFLSIQLIFLFLDMIFKICLNMILISLSNDLQLIFFSLEHFLNISRSSRSFRIFLLFLN